MVTFPSPIHSVARGGFYFSLICRGEIGRIFRRRREWNGYMNSDTQNISFRYGNRGEAKSAVIILRILLFSHPRHPIRIRLFAQVLTRSTTRIQAQRVAGLGGHGRPSTKYGHLFMCLSIVLEFKRFPIRRTLLRS